MNRLQWERKTVEKMMVLYCRDHHGTNQVDHADTPSAPTGNKLCVPCRELLDYAEIRINNCRYRVEKPTCSACTTHCYQPAYRERIREVMRYSGPRMLLHHPLTALVYLWRKCFQNPAINR